VKLKMKRGEIWWAMLPTPRGSEPGFRRPVIIVSSNDFNTSQIQTVLVAVVTSNTKLANAPGNISLPKVTSKLKKDSVINVSQILTLDKKYLHKKVVKINAKYLRELDVGLRLVLSLNAYN